MKNSYFKILLILLTIIPILSDLTAHADWVWVSNGMGDVRVTELAANINTIFAATPENGVYLSTNNGTNWTHTASFVYTVTSLAVNGNNIFAGTSFYDEWKEEWFGLVFQSTDNGTNWTQTSLNAKALISLAVNGNNVFAGTYPDNSVYLSTDNGESWNQTSFNSQSWVNSLAVKGDTVFAGCGDFWNSGAVYLSTNNGTSWTVTSLIIGVFSLALKGDTIFAGTLWHNGVYLSTNSGTTWTQTSLNNRDVGSLAVNGNNVFAGIWGPYGVYKSTNNGTSWAQWNEGLGNNLYIRAFCILNNYIFAGTDNSVYRRPLSDLVGIQPISEQLPAHFELSQNYPNPFNPTTKIRFALPKSSIAKLVIYDILGREISTHVNEQLNAGTYEVDWPAFRNASNYPSGVYYYKLTVRQAGSSTGDFTQTRKMVLIK